MSSQTTFSHKHTNGCRNVSDLFCERKEKNNHRFMCSSRWFMTLQYYFIQMPYIAIQHHIPCTIKNTEFKNYLIPAIVTSHLQKRLSNYHYPHKEGFSVNGFLLNMKLFIYLKILEVFKMRTQFMARSYLCTNTN